MVTTSVTQSWLPDVNTALRAASARSRSTQSGADGEEFLPPVLADLEPALAAGKVAEEAARSRRA